MTLALLCTRVAAQPSTDATVEQTAELHRIKQAAQEVASNPIFGYATEELRWRPKFGKEASHRQHKNSSSAYEQDSPATTLLATLIKWMILATLGFLICYLLAKFVRSTRLEQRTFSRKTVRYHPDSPIEVLAPLPDNVIDLAKAKIAENRVTEALSLLYRFTLQTLTEQQQLAISTSDTELSCLRKIQAHTSPRCGEYCEKLIQTWIRGAYAHYPPSQSEANQLCDDWNRVFAKVMGDS